MSFYAEYPPSGGGVTSLNTLTGALTLAAGTGISVASNGTDTLTITSTSQPAGNYITALTGDGAASGPGSAALTLATVNSNVGSFTNASITVNAKGLITAASSGTAGANVTLSNLTSPTAINQDLIPGTTNTISIGDGTHLLKTVYVGANGSGVQLQNGIVTTGSLRSVQTTPSGITNAVGLISNSVSTIGYPAVLGSLDEPTANANATGAIYIESGNKTAGTGNSGAIQLRTGTSAGGTRGGIRLQDGTQGTSGYVWTSIDTVGTGAWMAGGGGGGGANTALSNLASVAINADLAFGAGVTGVIQTTNDAAGSQDLTIKTGDSSGAFGGTLTLAGGSGAGDQGGLVSISGGSSDNFVQGVEIHGGVGNNVDGGPISILGGNSFGGAVGNGGAVEIHSGAGIDDFNSGSIFIGTNLATGSGASGTVDLKSGNANTTTGSGSASGTVTIASGDAAGIVAAVNIQGGTGTDTTGGPINITGGSGGAGGGSIVITSGQATVTDVGGANIALLTGGASGGGSSGAVTITTGNSIDGPGGVIALSTGATSGTGATGDIFIESGNPTGTGGSGNVNLTTGSPLDVNPSGSITLQTGNAVSTALAGNINLTGGASVDGNSGSIILTTQPPSGTGVRGVINVNSDFLTFAAGGTDAKISAAGVARGIAVEVDAGQVAALTSGAGFIEIIEGVAQIRANGSFSGQIQLNASTIDMQGPGNNVTAPTLNFWDANDNKSIGFKAPLALTANTVLTLPDGDGTAGQALVTNGSGTLSWNAVNTIPSETALGTLTWAGGVAPSGTISKTYRSVTNGRQITILAKITATVAGTAVTAVSFPLPAGLPNPATWGTQESGGLISPGAGSIATAVSGAVSGSSGLYDDGAGGYVIKIFDTAAINATDAYCSLTYIY